MILYFSAYKNKYGILDENATLQASRDGDVKFLEWFKNSSYEFKYDKMAINLACYNGHIQVLEWFKNSGYEFKYDEGAIHSASVSGQIQVLEWFKNSGYGVKYNEDVINIAVYNSHVQVLEWFKNYCNIKKIMKISISEYHKTIKFKTKNNYIKGYNKN